MAAAEVLTGRVNPSGRLADTIARDISDYPSTRNFGNGSQNIFAEDIYVGYRYFETFAKDKVLYPFGFGLSYTEFSRRVTYTAASGKLFPVPLLWIPSVLKGSPEQSKNAPKCSCPISGVKPVFTMIFQTMSGKILLSADRKIPEHPQKTSATSLFKAGV